MAIHPCFGGSLQTGSKIVAIVEMVLSIFIIIASLVVLPIAIIFVATVGPTIGNNSTTSSNSTTTISPLDIPIHEIHGNISTPGPDVDPAKAVLAIGIFVTIVAIIELICGIFALLLSVLLWVGAKHRNVRHCRIWLIIRSILMVFNVVGFITQLCNDAKTAISPSSVYMILSMYCMWVVYEFINELREEESASTKRSMYPYTNKA